MIKDCVNRAFELLDRWRFMSVARSRLPGTPVHKEGTHASLKSASAKLDGL
jgi:hypothetical protein